MGVLCASCGAALYPEAGLLWNPAILLSQIQLHGSPATRAVVFFASLPLVASSFLITVTGAAIAGGSKWFQALRGNVSSNIEF